MIETQESYNNIESSANKISLTDLLNMILSNWYWFIISVIFCGSIALLYLNYKAPIYQRTATVLVKDSRKGSGTEVTAFNDIIGGLGRRSVDNEVHIFKSRRIMEQVVLKHDLTTRYSTKHGIRTIDLYGRTPLIVKFINVDPAEVISFKYKIDGDNIYFSDFLNIEGLKITAKVGDTITTPLCDITTIATPYFDKNSNLSVMVNKMPLNEVVESYRKRLKCDIIDKQASVITISMVDQVPLRAEHVINGVIDAYNVDAIEDKQAISNLTEEFISERLATLGKELNIADSDIATFKQDNHLFSLKEEATLGAEEIKRLKKDKLALEVNLEMAEYILNYLHDTRNERALIPASTITMSGASSALEKHVELYNTNVLNYQRLLNASSETNPIIVDLGNQISNVRNTIISSLGILSEITADKLVEHTCQSRVSSIEPSSVNYTVGNVGKLPRSHLIEIMEDSLLKNIAVERRNAVYVMRANDGKVSHSYLVIRNDSHSGDSVPVTGIEVPKVSSKSSVNLVNNHKDSGKLHSEEVYSPALKRLGKNGMVGIRNSLYNHAPSIVPSVGIYVHKYTHKLGDSKSGMCIVDMNRNLVLETVKRAVLSEVVADNGLKRCGNKEILLSETKKLTLIIIICRIELLGNLLGIIVIHIENVVVVRRSLTVEVRLNLSCSPKANGIYCIGR